MMKTKQIFGWVLLGAGVIIIFCALYGSYNIFTGAKPAPVIFKMQEKQIAKQSSESATDFKGQIQEQIQGAMSEQIQNILPADFLPKLLNLSSWSMFAFILFSGGTKLFGLGVKLLKV